VTRGARVGLGACLLAALTGLALVWALPRWIEGDALRARIEAGARNALGRELRWQRLELAGSPFELRMLAPRIQADGAQAAPFAQAPEAQLHWAAAPSLTQPLWIDRVAVSGATLWIGDAELRDVEATLARAAPAAPLRIEAAFRFAGGGRGQATGSVTSAGLFDLVVTLEAVEVERAADGLALKGAVSGRLALSGPTTGPDRFAAQLALEARELELEQVSLRGPLAVDLALSGPQAARGGHFRLDASQADLRFGGSYRKPRGTPATVRGRIVAGNAGGLGVDDVKLRIGGDAGAER
jgi:hypothetical protein